MDDLTTWLRAQLDDDERVAKRVEPNQAPTELRAMVTREGSQPFLVIDSARVLAEVDAKRRILDRHSRMEVFGTVFCSYCCTLQGQRPGNGYWPCPEILDAAAPYAERPGYREEWRA